MPRRIPRSSVDPSPGPAGRRLRRLALPCWPIVAVLALFLSACQLHQEIRFNPDGSGTATATVGIDKTCERAGKHCAPDAERLLAGEGPVANAEADAESLPFDVVIEPFESPDGTQIGYTLSFDFASVEELERKLAAPTGLASPTSPLLFQDIVFEHTGGGFAFDADVRVRPEAGWPSVWLSIVLPGEAREANAFLVRDATDGTRFTWEVERRAPGEQPVRLWARTHGEAGRAIWLGALAVAIMVAAAVAVVAMMRRKARRPGTPDGDAVSDLELEVPARHRTPAT